MSGKFIHTQTSQQSNIKIPNPVTPEQLAQARNIEAQLPVLNQQIIHARNAGIDVTQATNLYNDLSAKLKAFISVYGNPANFA